MQLHETENLFYGEGLDADHVPRIVWLVLESRTDRTLGQGTHRRASETDGI
jgi:hypothetical protein